VQGVQHPYCTKCTVGVLRPLHAPWRKKSYLKDYLTLPKRADLGDAIAKTLQRHLHCCHGDKHVGE